MIKTVVVVSMFYNHPCLMHAGDLQNACGLSAVTEGLAASLHCPPAPTDVPAVPAALFVRGAAAGRGTAAMSERSPGEGQEAARVQSLPGRGSWLRGGLGGWVTAVPSQAT